MSGDRELEILEEKVAGTQNGHITEDILEAYSLGRLPETEVAPIEEHLLVCAACQDRLQATDLFVATIRHVLRTSGAGGETREGNGSAKQG